MCALVCSRIRTPPSEMLTCAVDAVAGVNGDCSRTTSHNLSAERLPEELVAQVHEGSGRCEIFCLAYVSLIHKLRRKRCTVHTDLTLRIDSRADLSCDEVVPGGVLINPPACCPHGMSRLPSLVGFPLGMVHCLTGSVCGVQATRWVDRYGP